MWAYRGTCIQLQSCLFKFISSTELLLRASGLFMSMFILRCLIGVTDHFLSLGLSLSHTPKLQKEHFSATGHRVSDRFPPFATNLWFIYGLLKKLSQYGFSRLANSN